MTACNRAGVLYLPTYPKSYMLQHPSTPIQWDSRLAAVLATPESLSHSTPGSDSNALCVRKHCLEQLSIRTSRNADAKWDQCLCRECR